MKGMVRTAWLLLTASRLQRWLLGIDLGIALLALPDRHTIAGLLALAIAMIGPILTGGLLFRDLSAPRAVSLIPSGRVQLLCGALLQQLLLSGVAAAIAHRLLDVPHAPTLLTLFANVFGIATLFFLSFFCTSGLRYGSLVWLALVLCFPSASLIRVSGQPLRAFLLMPEGVHALLTVEVLAWLCFGALYLKVRRVRPMGWDSVRTRRQAQAAGSAPPRPRALPTTTPGALRMLLTGNTDGWLQRCLWPALIVGLCLVLPVALAFLSTQGHSTGPTAYIRARIVCAFAGPAAALFASAGMERVRTLWLVAGLDRLALMKVMERNAWYTLGLTEAFACIAALLLCVPAGDPLVSGHAVGLLALPLSSGAAFLYVNLLRVRGPNPLDRLILGGFTALLAFQVICALTGIAASLLDELAAGEAVLAAVLRTWAVRRWQRIDWLVFRPSLEWTRLAR